MDEDRIAPKRFFRRPALLACLFIPAVSLMAALAVLPLHGQPPRTASAQDSAVTAPPSGRPHHVVFNVDGGPKLISSVVDGQVCDGGADRPFGWSRFYPRQDKNRNPVGADLGDVSGGATLKLPAAGLIEGLRIYDRYLRTTETIGNHRAGVASFR